MFTSFGAIESSAPSTPSSLNSNSSPTGWKKVKTPNGKTFYMNRELNLTRWTPPTTPSGESLAVSTKGHLIFSEAFLRNESPSERFVQLRHFCLSLF